MKNNIYIHHMPYLRDSIAYDHDFWYSYVKWWYLQAFFEIFVFWAVRGAKGQKMAKMKNNKYICHMPYLKNSIAYNHDFWYASVKWLYLQAFLSFFWNFHFSGGGKRVKNNPKWKMTITSITCYISGTT